MDQKYILKAGLKHFSEKWGYLVSSELTQLHDMETFTPLNSSKIYSKDKSGALESHIFLEEKGMTILKGGHV